LIHPIIDNYIFRTDRLGPSRVAPPTPGAWGFHFDPSTDLGFECILRLINSPPPDKPKRQTKFLIKFRRFKALDFQDQDQYPLEDPLLINYLWKNQENPAVNPLVNLPTPTVVCYLVTTTFRPSAYWSDEWSEVKSSP
jgi:hypothetical protein